MAEMNNPTDYSSQFNQSDHYHSAHASYYPMNVGSSNPYFHSPYLVKDYDPNSMYGSFTDSMSQLSIHPRMTSRYRPRYHYRNYDNNYRMQSPTPPRFQSKLHADSPVFTPSLMSIRFPTETYSNNGQMPISPVENSTVHRSISSAPSIRKKTNFPQHEFYIDRFASNFSDKSSSNSNSKSKVKHVTFQESSNVNENDGNSSSDGYDPSSSMSPERVYYSTRVPHRSTYDQFYNPYANNYYPTTDSSIPFHSMNTQRFRGYYPMFGRSPSITNPSEVNSQRRLPLYQPKQLYDPNKSVPTKKVEPSSPITILRRTSDENEEKSVSTNEIRPISFPAIELLPILLSANSISSLNEYAQQKKISVVYEYSSPSPSTFSCVLSIDGHAFVASPAFSSKVEAQQFACEQTLRTLFRRNSSIESDDQHDLIAHRSVSKYFHVEMNSNFFGRKTLASISLVIDGNFHQARTISFATGNICLDENNLIYADDGIALHDCHAEVLARRGFIRFLFEEMKRCRTSTSEIVQFDLTTKKFSLCQGISFHLYISSFPCGNASLNSSIESLRYKQGQIEGTLLASNSSAKYPIKSCSDKISRWNILGIQGGLLINLLTEPIYFQSLTIGCEPTISRDELSKIFVTRFENDRLKISSPFRINRPKIDFPRLKSLQQERQVGKLQSLASAWNVSRPSTIEFIEPITGLLKETRSTSTLSKKSLFKDFLEFLRTNFSDDENPNFKFETYQQAKRLDPIYVETKTRLSTALQENSPEKNLGWHSKSDQLEQFSI